MTAEKKPLTLEESVQAVQEEHEDLEDVKAVLAMSAAELDQKLEEQGIDPKALEARAAAREAAIRKEQDKKPWFTRVRALITALWMLLAAAATHAIDVWRAAEPTLSTVTHAAPPDIVREEALAECRQKRWQSCLDKLDEAAHTDPEGDKRDDIQRARALAQKQLSNPSP